MKLFCSLLTVNERELNQFQSGLRFRRERGEGAVEGLALSGMRGGTRKEPLRWEFPSRGSCGRDG
ncbi:hypothetical protein CXU01_05295 [Akkermansia muciniphila]|nr:hypothetical protein CXU01_05295 [Akkermansia muciniphila]